MFRSLIYVLSSVLSKTLLKQKCFQYRGSNIVYKFLLIFSRIYKMFFITLNYVIVPTPYGKLLIPKAGYASNRVLTLVIDLIEPQWKREFESIIRNAKCMIDVGAASDGYYSLKACRLNPSIYVIAVEPLFTEYYWLMNNVVLNNLQNNVRVLKKALGSRNDVVKINGEIVECITLDELTKKYYVQQVDVVKMDVEGWGYEVITGGMAMIKNVDLIYFLKCITLKKEKPSKC